MKTKSASLVLFAMPPKTLHNEKQNPKTLNSVKMTKTRRDGTCLHMYWVIKKVQMSFMILTAYQPHVALIFKFSLH